MKKIIVIIILVNILKTSSHGSGGHKWNYEDQGPSSWSHISGLEDCGRSHQSPINILDNSFRSSNVRCGSNILKQLDFTNFDGVIGLKVVYDGKTITANPFDEINMTISGSGLPRYLQPFKFIQFHFHWARDIDEGSEHHINGIGYPLELHIVHRSMIDPKYYAVIAGLFELQSRSNPYLNNIIHTINYLSTEFDHTKYVRVNVRSLLPQNVDNFYYYEGSLTTPPCSETVFWTIIQNKIAISKEQISSFRNGFIKSNVRPMQPLNHRDILTSNCNDTFNNDASKFSEKYLVLPFYLNILFIITLF